MNDDQTFQKVGGVGIVFIGILALLFSGWTFYHYLDYYSRATLLDGIVVRFESAVKYNRVAKRDETLYRPVIQFVDEFGETREFTAREESWRPRFKVDDIVKILYIADTPAETRLQSAVSARPPLFIGFVGFAFVILGVLLYEGKSLASLFRKE